MKPHKHAELIKQWADGATIECNDCGVWFYANNPTWQEHMEYRIKPEPKPDIVLYSQVSKCEKRSVHDWLAFVSSAYTSLPTENNPANLKLTFDGETGELKSAEVLKLCKSVIAHNS